MADSLAQQALGRGDVDVPGTGDHVDGRAVGCPVAEHRDGLSAAGCVHFGDAEQSTRRQDGRVRQPVVLRLRRRRHGDLGDPGYLGRDDVHEYRGRIGHQATRHVDASTADRQVSLGDRGSGRNSRPGLGRALGLVDEPGTPRCLSERRAYRRVEVRQRRD